MSLLTNQVSHAVALGDDGRASNGVNPRDICRFGRYALITLLFFGFTPALVVHAQEAVRIDASKLLPRVSVSFAPRQASFIEGSTFEVPIIIDTQGARINAIDLRINFDQDKLTIIRPSGGKSIVGIWVEPPAYDNSRGTASYSGVVPDGIITNSGIVGTITFRARSSGTAVVSIRRDSSILLNDGLGTEASLDFGRAVYEIIPKPPEGVRIFSETHPDQSKFYNNNSPVILWEKDPGVLGFSFLIDDKPFTVPENNVSTAETVQAYQNLGDGLWYFHIKAYKNKVWGTTAHFLLKIDTTPPAAFTPKVEYALAAAALVERVLISFFTTDNLSDIDHYEVGVIDKGQPVTVSPVFVHAESPFQTPLPPASGFRVIVRAVDKAGNVRDASTDVKPPLMISRFVGEYKFYVIGGVFLVITLTLVMRYFIGHRVLAHLRRAIEIIRRDNASRAKPPTPPANTQSKEQSTPSSANVANEWPKNDTVKQ